MSSREMAEALARLDHSTAAVDRLTAGAFLEDHLPRRGPGREYGERVAPMLRRSIKTLVVAGGLGEVAHQPHLPEVFRDRARTLGPEMGISMGENLALLRSMTPRRRRRLAQTLRARPELPLSVAESLDVASVDLGVAPSTRFKLRRLGARVSSALPRQSTGGYVEDVSQQMTKMMTYRGVEMRVIDSLATSSLAATSSLDAKTSSDTLDTSELSDAEDLARREAQRNRGQATINVGAYLVVSAFASLGLGALVTAVTGNPFGLLVGGLTVGGILLVVGLVILIVGAVVRGSA